MRTIKTPTSSVSCVTCIVLGLALLDVRATSAQEGVCDTRNLALDTMMVGLTENRLGFHVGEGANGDLNQDGDIDDGFFYMGDPHTGEVSVSNIELSVLDPFFHDHWLLFSVRERDEGRDLNGDGDVAGDDVLHILDLESGEITNTALAIDAAVDAPGEFVKASGPWIAFNVREDAQDQDLNGDGDEDDFVLHTHDLNAGETTNVGVAVYRYDASSLQLSGDWLAFAVPESGENQGFQGNLHVRNLRTQETRNLGLPVNPFDVHASEERLVFTVSEFDQARDLNGDGDLEDHSLYAYEFGSGELQSIAGAIAPEAVVYGDHRVVFSVLEAELQQDLDGDGKIDARVLLVHDFRTEETDNSGIACTDNPGVLCLHAVGISGDWLVLSQQGVVRTLNLASGRTHLVHESVRAIQIAGDWIGFYASEWGRREGREGWFFEDYNGDGDTEDSVMHVHHLPSGVTTNLKVAVECDPLGCWYWLAGNALVFCASERSEGRDLNEDGDRFDFHVLHVVPDLTERCTTPRFRRADSNNDGKVDIADAVNTLSALFLGQTPLDCADAGDSNDDGRLNITDPIVTLSALFLGQGPIPLPGVTECGIDPTDDDLGCVEYRCN